MNIPRRSFGRKRMAAFGATLGVVLVAAIGWQALQTTYASAVSTTAFVNGTLNYPAAVRHEIDRLDNALDQCMLLHGATRVALGMGWTYDDPQLRASAACHHC